MFQLIVTQTTDGRWRWTIFKDGTRVKGGTGTYKSPVAAFDNMVAVLTQLAKE